MEGKFLFLLDAVDEVKPSLRENIIKQIMQLAREFPQCGVIVSTRPDQTIESLSDFTVYHSSPLSKNQVISIINKIDYDREIKARLVSKLRSGLFEQLEEFLVSPLLVTILLLTFGHTADIPTKITSFINRRSKRYINAMTQQKVPTSVHTTQSSQSTDFKTFFLPLVSKHTLDIT